MNIKNRLLAKLGLLLICGTLVTGTAYAQRDDAEREARDNQKTKTAQAVSKEFFDRIQKAQEMIDEDNQTEALKMLNSLKTKKGITEYELQQVLNYIGFVQYNLDNVDEALAAYEELLTIPSIEDQIRKQTLYTMAQLSTMQENYLKKRTILTALKSTELLSGLETPIS